jgi:HEPN domain-containing protein
LLGIRVIHADDPVAAALELAEELGAELIDDEASAEAAVAARVEAGRTEAVALSPDELAELRARAALGGPSIDAATLHELRRLASELGRAERIRSRTEVSLTEHLTQRLSNGSTVSIHPSSIREAAAAVVAAEAELADAEHALAQVGEEPVPEPAEPAPMAFEDLPSAVDEASSTRRRGNVAVVAVVLILLGAAVVLFALGAPPVAAGAVVALALAAGFVLTVRGRREQEDTVAVSERSSALASATAHITLAEDDARTREMRGRWLDNKLGLQMAVERVGERARSARRHWESLTGPDADPYDIDGVLRARDPQFELLGAATKASPTVRTANALHRAAAARWRIAWAGLGHPEPPTLDEADLMLAHLGGEQDEESGKAAQARLEAAEAWTAACEVLDRSLVFVEPSAWLSESRLESLLLSLPAGAEAIVVEGPE